MKDGEARSKAKEGAKGKLEKGLEHRRSEKEWREETWK